MTVKPYITLLFILSVFTFLLAITVFFPADGIILSKNFSLRFARADELLYKNKVKYADITSIIKHDAYINDTSLANLAVQESNSTIDTTKADGDSLSNSLSHFQFSNNNHTILYPVFAALDNAINSSKPVRIIHYGDSQIEGDRITSYLRNRLQQKFGGFGVGLVPLEQMYDFGFSINQQNSNNWLRYTLYGNRDTYIPHNNFGALAGFCRFNSYTQDTSVQSNKETEAWVSFKSSPFSYQNTKTFQQCRIFYSSNRVPFLAEIYQDGVLADADMYPGTKSLKTMRWVFDRPVSNIKIVFKGLDSPDLYGIALDGISGVAVDNIAMRGSSGLVFTKMNANFLQEHFIQLNVKMVILQFGGNVVPHIIDNYTYYENLFYSQLKRIKELLPNAGIVVIGVADMSIKEKDSYVSYPNIEKVRDALKNATFKADAVYWDLYEAMGGHNSMPSWVFANPSLASSDFVHFNARGAKIIAQMFYNSLIYEYTLYKKNIENNNDAQNN
jgi:lysophospholipase L1-like esterase/sulfur relay (sulfurtransferase) DsrF/TusC family protein